MKNSYQKGASHKKNSKSKKNRFSHTDNTKYGMGDNYGTGIRANLGKIREDSVGMVHISPKKLKKPPKSVA